MSFPTINSNFRTKKQLVLQKISINDKANEDYRKHLDQVFSDPNDYFSNTYHGMRSSNRKKTLK